MKNKLFHVASVVLIMLFAACNNEEKIKAAPPSPENTSPKKIISSQMTPGQIHNQILEAYIQQYGIVLDNEVTVAEVETLCDRIAQISVNQGFSGGMTETELSDNLFNSYVNSDAFVNGVLRPTNELITMSINSVPNQEIRNVYTQIQNMANQGDPDFIENATQLLNNMQGLNQEEQLQVNGFKSILQSSYDLWTTPTPSGGSYLPTGAMDYQIIAMADAAGARRGYYNDWSPGTTGAAEADERAANCSAAASVAAGGRP